MASPVVCTHFAWTEEVSSRSSSPEVFNNNFSDADDDPEDDELAAFDHLTRSSSAMKGKNLNVAGLHSNNFSPQGVRHSDSSSDTNTGYHKMTSTEREPSEGALSDVSVDGCQSSPRTVYNDDTKQFHSESTFSDISRSRINSKSKHSSETHAESLNQRTTNAQCDVHIRVDDSKGNVNPNSHFIGNDSGGFSTGKVSAHQGSLLSDDHHQDDLIDRQNGWENTSRFNVYSSGSNGPEVEHREHGLNLDPGAKEDSATEISWRELEQLQVKTGLRKEQGSDRSLSPSADSVRNLDRCSPQGSFMGIQAGSRDGRNEDGAMFDARRWRTEDWYLQDAELQGPSMVLGSVCHVDETLMDHHPPDMSKSKRSKFPRVFHSRTDDTGLMGAKGLGKKLQILSPLAILGKYAKKSGTDVAKLLDNTDQFGLNMPMSCMQCVEKYGKLGNLGYGFGEDDYETGGQTTEGRCKRCGGQISTLKSFGQTILKLRQKILDNDLEPYDVYPDGNCLFGAVVDQLRIQGDFRFTIHNLRHAAVEYLRQNPNAEDGTPYAMFMADTTWEEYLSHMSEDGEWGDHMVISAISNLLSQRIVIYGGMSGDGCTVIYPKGQGPDVTTDGEEQVPDSQKMATDGRNDSKERKEGSMESKTTATDGKAGATDTVKEAGGKNEGSSERKESVVRWEKKESDIYLGHIGESHYISLRPHNWEITLDNRILEHQIRWQHDVRYSQSHTWTNPLTHINFLLKLVHSLRYIKGVDEERAGFTENSQKSGEVLMEFVGPRMTQLLPTVTKIEGLTPDIHLFFGSSSAIKPQEMEKVKGSHVYLMSPLDTVAVMDRAKASKLDLIVEKLGDDDGFVRLVPSRARVWEGQTVHAGNRKYYLKWIESAVFEEMQSAANVFSWNFGFKCSWPNDALEWLTRQRVVEWPGAWKLDEISQEGCHVLPYRGTDTGTRKDDRDIVDYVVPLEVLLEREAEEGNFWSADAGSLTWVYTFAVAERELSRCFTSSQKFCFHLFQLLVDKVIQSPKIHASILKSVFFHACENIPSSTWESQPADCLFILLKKLDQGLGTCRIPHYFLSNSNLLHGVERETTQMWRRKLDQATSQPVLGLYFLLDKHGLTATEVGPYLDDIIEDTFRFAKHGNIARSISDVIFPAGYVLLNNLIQQGEYQYAMAVMTSLKEQADSIGQRTTYGKIIAKAVWDVHIGYSWCLALFMDISMGTSVTQEICAGYQTVPITEVFGPEIIEEIPNTVVPAMLQIPNGDLNFPLEIVKVMQKLGNDRLLIKCLRYYIETYNDIAGEYIVICSSRSRSATYYASMLYDLYVILFNAYYTRGESEEFRDLMPSMTRLIESGYMTKSAGVMSNTRMMWRSLGEYDKAKEYSHSASSNNALQQMTSLLFGSMLGQ